MSNFLAGFSKGRFLCANLILLLTAILEFITSNSFSSVDKIKFMNDLRTSHFTDEEIRSIIKVLKERKFISSAVICKSPEDKPIEDFLLNFWDFEKSPYVKEKKLKNQTIHQSYCATMKSRVKLYWIPMLIGRSVGSITRKDVQQIFNDESILKLAPKTINSIVSSLTVPLKWAFFNDLTENNCFDGILKCGQKSQSGIFSPWNRLLLCLQRNGKMIQQNLQMSWHSIKEMEYGLFRIPVPEFTPGAFREGLLNAFCHRDYTQLGQVRVLIDDEGMTISSQGGFIEGVNSENLIFVEPHGRNPCLSDVLKRVGLAEKTGRGIDRIYEGSILYGRPWPDYSESTSSIVKLFVSRANPDMQFTKMIADEQNRRNQPLSINALMILSTIRNERRVTAERLSEVIHLNKSRTSSTIENLVEAGLVEAIGNGVNRSYILSAKVYKQNNESVKYVRQTDIDAVRYPELIIKLAKRQDGVITKEDVAELLKITNVQAYLQIKKLLAEGKLVLNQKGKYANYKVKD